MSSSETRNYTVEGMTCHHCQLAVGEEVGEVEGVDEVRVDLQSGRLEVSGTGVDDAAVRVAVEEAGYRLAGAP